MFRRSFIKVDCWESPIEIQVLKSATIIESEARGGQSSEPVERLKKALKNPFGMDGIKSLVNKGSRVTVAFDDPIKLSPNYLSIPLEG